MCQNKQNFQTWKTQTVNKIETKKKLKNIPK